VSVGGLFSPLLGWLADRTDLRVALMVLVAVPAVALLLTRGLGEPRPAS
jgi:FSR family fosmidomycin resistance protein-like MFS transporter